MEWQMSFFHLHTSIPCITCTENNSTWAQRHSSWGYAQTAFPFMLIHPLTAPPSDHTHSIALFVVWKDSHSQCVSVPVLVSFHRPSLSYKSLCPGWNRTPVSLAMVRRATTRPPSQVEELACILVLLLTALLGFAHSYALLFPKQ